PPKLSPLTKRHAGRGFGSSRVIITVDDSGSLPDVAAWVSNAGGSVHRTLPLIHAHVVDMPNQALNGLVNNPHISHGAFDRLVVGTNERTGATVGATAVREQLGYDGTGVGVAVIDSGITSWHDDLSGGGTAQRVDRFVDFVNDRETAYDDYGHGTHVA